MKILWVCPFFLHPTDRGAQIRTLGTLKQLSRRHEIHFAALNDPANLEGPSRAPEYSARSFSVAHAAPSRRSLAILPQLVRSLFDSVPIAVSRYKSSELRRLIGDLMASEHYDAVVCDFLAAAPNVPDLSEAVLFQHNVETTIWQRHAAQSAGLAKKFYTQLQARKMEAYERTVCRESRHVIAVSEIDAIRMNSMFGIDTVTAVRTGVDVDYFAPPAAATLEAATPSAAAYSADIVFCGSMDWLPNTDAVLYFMAEILPLIRARIPGATFTIAGRSPEGSVVKAAQAIPGVNVTGKVDDMRPYLWGAKISIVPIRIGGGTRLKIYECFAAGLATVSTTVGAEGLRYTVNADILIADQPQAFADACIYLLLDEGARQSIARNALHLVQSELSWAAVSRDFEEILVRNRLTAHEAAPALTGTPA
jgi:glycosyltransferase involved in cell wall biosynthesis